MRILGIDYGDKNIGLAVSDKLLITAQALNKYRLKNTREDIYYFKNLVQEYEITKIVIGLPLRMDGTPGTRVQKTKEFACWLENCLNLPISFWDERLTTKQASKIISMQKIKKKSKRKYEDQLSAAIILSSYLESIQTNPNVP